MRAWMARKQRRPGSAARALPWRDAETGLVASAVTPPQGGRNEHDPRAQQRPERGGRAAAGTVAHQPAAVRPQRPRARDDPGARRHRTGLAPDPALPLRQEIIYVLQGPLEYQIDGQPTKVYNTG